MYPFKLVVLGPLALKPRELVILAELGLYWLLDAEDDDGVKFMFWFWLVLLIELLLCSSVYLLVEFDYSTFVSSILGLFIAFITELLAYSSFDLLVEFIKMLLVLVRTLRWFDTDERRLSAWLYTIVSIAFLLGTVLKLQEDVDVELIGVVFGSI